MSGYTAGKLMTARSLDGGWYILNAEHYPIATVYTDEADARVLSAAPDMLAIIREIEGYMLANGLPAFPDQQRAQSLFFLLGGAIHRATGNYR